ncbi:hypothetical protein [Desulfuromusa kysingii]|nr:hypothetical protein [Desulfuromusa kysingii]
MKKINMLMVFVSLLVLVAPPAFAQGEAVSAINGQVVVTGGSLDGENMATGSASLTAPLGEHFGLRLDGLSGNIDRDDFRVGAIHLFTRDPDLYLLGVTGAHAELENIQVESFSLEVEAYMGMVTIAAAGGQQTGDVHDSTYGSLDLRYYPQKNLMVEVGASVADENDGKAHIGVEYQLVGGLALFADAATGEDGFEHALGGIRYYFGDEKPLINRHREEVSTNNVLDSVIINYASARSAVLASDIR